MKPRTIASIPFVVLLLAACRGRSPEGPPTTRLPPPDDTKPAVVRPVPGPLTFFFADQFDRLFVRISGEGWEPSGEGLGAPLLEHSSDVVAVSRVTAEKNALTGVAIDVYRGENKACSFTVGPLAVVSRAYPHFGQRDDLGVTPNQDKKQVPDFEAILSQSWHYLAAVVGPCGAPGPNHERELVWARPSASADPGIWARLPEGDSTAKEQAAKVAPQAMGMAFGRHAADYGKANPDEVLTTRVAVFAGPSPGEFLVEDFRQIGETTCGGDGHEQWSLWLVRDGQARLIVSEDARKRLELVADLDGDGHPEAVAEVNYYGNERTLFRLKDGKLEPVVVDKYPFNDCGCCRAVNTFCTLTVPSGCR
jgi:hypothetical protein